MPLANNPPLILADEPTGELDSITGGKVMELLIELNKTLGTTTIVVTHDENISKKAKHIIRIRDGGIINDVCKDGFAQHD